MFGFVFASKKKRKEEEEEGITLLFHPKLYHILHLFCLMNYQNAQSTPQIENFVTLNH